MEFRPCIDIHDGKVKQIVGASLSDKGAKENFVSEQDAAFYADMYRDWMKQLADGVGILEAVIPLTADRIPFIVRYTTEFDENGRPLKAYGAATQVVDDMDDK